MADLPATDTPPCDPDWTHDYEPSDRTPTPWDLRRHEINDSRYQGRVGPSRLWTAHTLPTEEYL